MFKDKQIKKVVANLINEAGNYKLQVMNYAYVNSFVQDFSSTIKAQVFEKIAAGELWCKPVGQLAVTLGHAVAEGKKSLGVITVRFQENGFVKPEDAGFDAALLKQKDHKIIDGYVCKLNAEKQFERIVDAEKTEACERMVFSFFNKLGYEEGSINEVLQSAITDKATINAEVYIDHYEESAIPKIKKWFAVREDEETEEDVTANMSAADFAG